jgi:hypothetical protein
VSAFDDRPRNTVDQVEALDLFITEEEYLKEMGAEPGDGGVLPGGPGAGRPGEHCPRYLLTAAGLEKL